MDSQSSKRGQVLSAIESKATMILSTISLPEERSTGIWQVSTSTSLSLRRLEVLARGLAVLRAIYASSTHSTSIMKRDIYYSDVKILRNQATVDRILQQFTSLLSVSLPECFVHPAARGLVFGPLNWIDAENQVSASSEVQMIPSVPFRCSHLSVIVVVEKESIFREVANEQLFRGLDCLFVTAKGYPNFQTLNFLHTIATRSQAPVFVLTDADPFGIDVYACYRRGSSVNHFRELPNCHWIGLKMEDVPQEHHMALTAADRKAGARLWDELSGLSWTDAPLLRAQLELMARVGCKAEMEAVIGSTWRGHVLEAEILQLMRSAGLSWTALSARQAL